MKANLFLVMVLSATLFSCDKSSNNPAQNPTQTTNTNSTNTNSTTCLQSSLITSVVPAFTGPDSVYQLGTYKKFYTIYSDGISTYTSSYNGTFGGSYVISNFPQSNCPGSYMNSYIFTTNYSGNWASNEFNTVTLSIIGPGDSSLWRTKFSPGRYGVHFNSNSTQITNRWGTPCFTYSSINAGYGIDYKGISGVDNYHDIMEIKNLGRLFILGTGEVSRFSIKGEMKLKMRQFGDTSITKNIKIIYKELFTIKSGV
jgi:hypothetical protein